MTPLYGFRSKRQIMNRIVDYFVVKQERGVISIFYNSIVELSVLCTFLVWVENISRRGILDTLVVVA